MKTSLFQAQNREVEGCLGALTETTNHPLPWEPGPTPRVAGSATGSSVLPEWPEWPEVGPMGDIAPAQLCTGCGGAGLHAGGIESGTVAPPYARMARLRMRRTAGERNQVQQRVYGGGEKSARGVTAWTGVGVVAVLRFRCCP
jgi:hypothetical protein